MTFTIIAFPVYLSYQTITFVTSDRMPYYCMYIGRKFKFSSQNESNESFDSQMLEFLPYADFVKHFSQIKEWTNTFKNFNSPFMRLL